MSDNSKCDYCVQSPADILVAYIVLIKSTLIGMELSEVERVEAKALFDWVYPQVLVDYLVVADYSSAAIH